MSLYELVGKPRELLRYMEARKAMGVETSAEAAARERLAHALAQTIPEENSLRDKP